MEANYWCSSNRRTVMEMMKKRVVERNTDKPGQRQFVVDKWYSGSTDNMRETNEIKIKMLLASWSHIIASKSSSRCISRHRCIIIQ